MSGPEFIDVCAPFIAKLALKAASQFGEDRADWEQEFSLAVLKRAHLYDPARGRPTTFVAQVAASVVRNRIVSDGYAKRRVSAQAVRLTDEVAFSLEDRKAVDPAEQAEYRDLVEVARRVIGGLTPLEGAAIYGPAGLWPRGVVSLEAVAKAFKVQRNTASAARQRGLTVLRERLCEAG